MFAPIRVETVTVLINARGQLFFQCTTEKPDLDPTSLSLSLYGQLVVLPVVYVARQLHHLFLQMFTDSANANIFCDSLTSSTEFYFSTLSRSYHEKELKKRKKKKKLNMQSSGLSSSSHT